jgi:hypothetical protein
LRQHGFESPEKSCAARAGEQNQGKLRHEAHAVLKITWFLFDMHVAQGVRCRLERFYTTFTRIDGISPGAQRLALVAGGWDESRRRNGKHPKPRKMPENAARTHLSTARLVGRR